MMIQIIRIEDEVVSCRLDDGQIIDIARKWLPAEIKLDDRVDFNVETAKN